MLASEASRSGWPGSSIRLPRSRLIAGVIGSFAALAIVLPVLDLDRLRGGLETAPEEPVVLLALLLAYTGAFLLRAYAWRVLLSMRLPAVRLFSILQTSLFLNHLLPVKAGEIARPYLAHRHGVPAAEAGSTVLVARLMDFVALSLLALIALPAVSRSTEAGTAYAAALALIAAGCVAVAFLRVRASKLAPRRFRAIATRLQTSLSDMSARQLVTAFPLVIASWALEAVVLVGSARFLAVELSPEVAIGATAFTILFQFVHFTPGGLGVYETSMTTVLVLQGVPAGEALALAVTTHALKFAYSFTAGLAFAAAEGLALLKAKSADGPRRACGVEILSARLWNVINEGKPFTPVFALTIAALVSLPNLADASYWPRAVLALVVLTPLALVFWRFDFPLKLRASLWVYLALFLAVFRFIDLTTVALVVSMYLVFTVIVWGSIYYHLRIGTPYTNFLRFWKLVLENPDPTSGNLQEQLPKLLMLTLAFQYLAQGGSTSEVLAIEGFTLFVALSGLLVHQWWFTWVPALPRLRARPQPTPAGRTSRRVIVIAIDGCRADRLREANTPCIDRLRAEGTEYTDVSTVYPARTVTCFTSMLTGAPARVHKMQSNFVPNLGAKCDSVFNALERAGLSGKLVGIAHLIDAFGEHDVRSVTAVMHNDEIDDALEARARLVLENEDPDLLVLQLLSVDQTGHARGSYNTEYLRKIEITDGVIERFLAWCDARGYLDEATVMITADHGQGIGIGGHGHMSPPEIHIPCILRGKGVPAGRVVHETRFITDFAPTVCNLLGVAAPSDSVGTSFLPVSNGTRPGPLVFVLPALNESATLPEVIASICRCRPTMDTEIVVVDDGSSDDTAEVARRLGAVVVRHDRNRGLGAALRTGLAEARELNARAMVFLDADGEYDAMEVERLLEPIEAGEADYVVGSRFRGKVEGMSASRRLANRCFSLLLSLVCGRWLSDGQSGFRAFSRRALDVAEIVHDYNYAQVLTMDLLHKGMRLQEVPIGYRRRSLGRSFVSAHYLWRVPLGMAREMLDG